MPSTRIKIIDQHHQTVFSADICTPPLPHLLLNKVISSYVPVWTHSLVKHSLTAMPLTKSALDMLVEDLEESFWAMYSLKVPEASFIPACSHYLSLGSIGALKLLLLFFKSIHELIDDFVECP